jgi:hypothetical protein
MTLVVKLLNFINHKKKLFNYLISLVVIFLISSLLLSCEKKLLHNFSGEIMGTSYKVLISDPLPSSVNQEVIFNILDSVNQEMSTYIPSSFLNELNNTKVNEWLSASKDFLKVIAYAKSACILSKGAFDVSIGGIVNLWGFGSADELDWPLGKVDYAIEEIGCESIQINNNTGSVRRVKDVYVDLSAIAKGYAVDKLSRYLNSKEFIEQIEKVTEINDLVYGDCNLNGAGIHIIKNKGRLAMHTDFNTYDHPKLGKLDRRINLLVYMNKDWNSNYKGDLLMYNPNNKLEVKSIQPIFNRCVIFNTTNKSVHGHPESLDVPNEDICRKSIAIYYYTKNKNKEVDFEGDHAHSTIWHEIPNNL